MPIEASSLEQKIRENVVSSDGDKELPQSWDKTMNDELKKQKGVHSAKKELIEEIGLEVSSDMLDLNTVIFDSVLRKDGNLMINSLFQIKIDEEIAENVINSSLLPTKLLSLEDLNEGNTWVSEIEAIKNFVSR